jgi:hypothetical protein
MPLIIPFSVNRHEYSVFVGIPDESIDRMRAYDPVEVPIRNLPEKWRSYRLKDVIIGYCTQEDYDTILPLIKADDFQGALRHLTRGFRYRPDLGDHDGPMLDVKSDPATKAN